MARPWAYIDTSLLAMRYLAEADSARFRRLMTAHRLVTSAITPLELCSALAQRRGIGDLTEAAYQATLARLDHDRDYCDTIPMTESVLNIAEDVVQRTGVRALDAVHLASALLRRDAGLPSLPFLTRDSRQAQGARLLGMTVVGSP